MQKDVTIEKSLCYFVACAEAAMESLQRLRPRLRNLEVVPMTTDWLVLKVAVATVGTSTPTRTTVFIASHQKEGGNFAFEYGDMAMLHYSRSQRIEQLEGLSR